MAGLSIHLLGLFHIDLDGQTVTSFGYDKVRALLAFLAVEAQRPHRREALAGLLWPDQSEKAAHDSLRNALAKLRHVIGDAESQPPYLLISKDAIQFNSSSDHWLDVTAFTSLLDESEHHPHTSLEACPECLVRLEQAAALYQGNFLVDFYLADSEPFEEWCSLRREPLKRKALEALHALVEGHIKRNELSQALPYVYRLVEMEPLDEESHRQLMRLLALNGQHTEALARYKQIQQLLVNELGIEPEDESQALYHQILSETRGELRIGNLPASVTPFIGRQAELAEIKSRLEDPGCRLLTILGPGGVGKTRLALEAAQGQRYNFPHGAYLVPLSALNGSEALFPAISEALRLSPGSSKNLRQQVLDYLRQKSLLLVMDSFEQILDGNEIAAELLRAAPGLKILVTSRSRLNIDGEQVYPLRGMQFPHPDDLETAAQFSAVQLFSSGARRSQPEFELNRKNTAGVVQVCQLVQGMPLGLLLACTWVVQFSPSEIALEIKKNLDFLSAEWRDLPGRQRSMRATFDYSWNLLADSEREALCRLSVFQGDFTREMAEEVAQVTLYALRSLGEKSLLMHSQDGRYGIHDLVYQFAKEKLAGLPEVEDAVRQRHSHYFLQAVEQWGVEQQGTRQVAALAVMDQELVEVQIAWEWACQHQYLKGLAQAWSGLGRYYAIRSRPVEGGHDFQIALDMLDGMPEFNPLALRIKAQILGYQSYFLSSSGRIDKSKQQQLFEQSLQILDGLQKDGEDVRSDMSWILKDLGITLSDPDPTRAIQLAQHGLELAQQTGNHRYQALALEALGMINYNHSELEEAEIYCHAALTEWRVLGDPMHMAEGLGLLSLISIYLGKTEASLQAARESAKYYRSIGGRNNYASSLTKLGFSLLMGRQWEEADRAFRDSLPYLEDIGDLHYINETYSNWCLVKTLTGQYETAKKMAQGNLEQANQLGDTYCKIVNHYVLGYVYLAQGHAEQAVIYLEKAAAFANQHGNRAHWAWAVGTLGLALSKLGQLRQAQELMVEALLTSLKIKSYPSLSFALPAVALFLAISGQVELAVELCGLIDEHALCGKTPWFEDVAGKTIKEMAASLPAEVVEAARERGKKRDLFVTAGELLDEFKAHTN